MDELFSCRNCIHNASQSLNVGKGPGYCLKHGSVIQKPAATTCKYLHRKDLPAFVVAEGIREHAAEFATSTGLVSLSTGKAVKKLPYSERFVWERRCFDPTVHVLAQYRKTEPSWVLVQAMAGGVDGRRSIAHAALVRRYMDHCGTWESSYRLVLALLQELATRPHFDDGSLNVQDTDELADVGEDAIWDVVFTKIAGLQEYGFHAGIKEIMWATDALNGGLSNLKWDLLVKELAEQQTRWTNTIIRRAKKEGVFFPSDDLSIPKDDAP